MSLSGRLESPGGWQCHFQRVACPCWHAQPVGGLCHHLNRSIRSTAPCYPLTHSLTFIWPAVVLRLHGGSTPYNEGCGVEEQLPHKVVYVSAKSASKHYDFQGKGWRLHRTRTLMHIWEPFRL